VIGALVETSGVNACVIDPVSMAPDCPFTET
jgi:hypothetical protein